MMFALSIAQIVISILVVGAILLQSQGAGLGSAWGGGGETYHTKRGVEKLLFIFTILAVIAFTALSFANLLLRRG